MKTALALMFDKSDHPARVAELCEAFMLGNPNIRREAGVTHVVAMYRNLVIAIDEEDRAEVLQQALGQLAPQYALRS